MRSVIGIDPSSKKLALCCSGNGFYSELHVIDLPGGLYSATGAAYREVFSFLKFAEGPVAVYLEAPLVGVGGVHSTIVQAQVGGAVIAAAQNLAVPLKLVNVGTWKKQVVGKGNAKKPEISEWVEKNCPEAYHLAEGDQDLIDAVCLNRYGIMYERLLSRRIRGRKKVEEERV